MKFTWRHFLLLTTLLLACAWWFHFVTPIWFFFIIGLFGASSIWPPVPFARWLCLALLFLTLARTFSNPSVRFVLILPNDYNGDFYLVQHFSGKDQIEVSGLWKTTVTMHIPKSGILVVPNKEPFHYWRDDELWRYEDGRIIRQWNKPLEPPFTHADMGGDTIGGVPDSSPLARYRGIDRMVHYVRGSIQK